MYTHFIFDLYGTLINIETDEENPSLWSKLCDFYGFNGAYYTPSELHTAYLDLVQHFKALETHTAYPDFPLENVFKALFMTKNILPSHDLVICAMQFFRILSTKYLKLYPGVLELLTHLKAHHKQLYILSNAQREFTLKEIRLLKLDAFFDGIYFSSDFNTCKPDAQFFNVLFEKVHLDPQHCLMIGNDFNSDCEGAYHVGIDSLYIHSNLSPDYPETFHARYKILRGGVPKASKLIDQLLITS